MVERVNAEATRRAHVLHDGNAGWIIDDGATRYITFSETSSMVISDSGLSFVHTRLAAAGWVKHMFRGDQLNLDRATGAIEDTEIGYLDRDCVLATVRGLRDHDPTAAYTLTVDKEDGIIMRMERADAKAELVVEKLTTAKSLSALG